MNPFNNGKNLVLPVLLVILVFVRLPVLFLVFYFSNLEIIESNDLNQDGVGGVGIIVKK